MDIEREREMGVGVVESEKGKLQFGNLGVGEKKLGVLGLRGSGAIDLVLLEKLKNVIRNGYWGIIRRGNDVNALRIA